VTHLPGQSTDRVRLDKWLWAARFFKTRQVAAEAVIGGKVHLNDQRTKPGKEVKVGDRLRIHKGSLEWDIRVEALTTQRRPAREAVSLFSEDAASRLERQQRTEQQRAVRAQAGPSARGRPSKRDRRVLQRFTGKTG
jgi:ribosome-associated heat shock protein Hsp15